MEQVQYYRTNWDLHHCSLLKSTLKKLCEMFSQHFPKIKGFLLQQHCFALKKFAYWNSLAFSYNTSHECQSMVHCHSCWGREQGNTYCALGTKRFSSSFTQKKIDKKLSWQAKTPGHRNEKTINTHHWGKWKENTMKKWQKPDSLIWMYCGIHIVKEQHSSDLPDQLWLFLIASGNLSLSTMTQGAGVNFVCSGFFFNVMVYFHTQSDSNALVTQVWDGPKYHLTHFPISVFHGEETLWTSLRKFCRGTINSRSESFIF